MWRLGGPGDVAGWERRAGDELTNLSEAELASRGYQANVVSAESG
jgi:hypothetical protein